jgi:hypothetical protein
MGGRQSPFPNVAAKNGFHPGTAAFLSTPQDSGAKFIAGDMPEANELTVHILAAGAQSLREIARGLNERHIEAPRGGSWHPLGVKRVLERLGA